MKTILATLFFFWAAISAVAQYTDTVYTKGVPIDSVSAWTYMYQVENLHSLCDSLGMENYEVTDLGRLAWCFPEEKGRRRNWNGKLYRFCVEPRITTFQNDEIIEDEPWGIRIEWSDAIAGYPAHRLFIAWLKDGEDHALKAVALEEVRKSASGTTMIQSPEVTLKNTKVAFDDLSGLMKHLLDTRGNQ